MYIGLLNGDQTFDRINRLCHKVRGKLHYPVQTKHSSHQYHEEWVKKIGNNGAMIAPSSFSNKYGPRMPY